jgi:hypothetical protein
MPPPISVSEIPPSEEKGCGVHHILATCSIYAIVWRRARQALSADLPSSDYGFDAVIPPFFFPWTDLETMQIPARKAIR